MTPKPAIAEATHELPLSARLRLWRVSHRWTQAMAAEHLRVSERTYENWEAGTNEPRGIGLKALEEMITK